MLFNSLIAVTLTLFTPIITASDEGYFRLAPRSLHRRQGAAFEPDKIPLIGSCSANKLVNCGKRLCIDPKLGDICCDPTQNWGCPTGSFCLTKGLCCPNGLDPSTCAAQNNISLPPGFKTKSAVDPSLLTEPATPTSTKTTERTTERTTSRTTSTAVPSGGKDDDDDDDLDLDLGWLKSLTSMLPKPTGNGVVQVGDSSAAGRGVAIGVVVVGVVAAVLGG